MRIALIGSRELEKFTKYKNDVKLVENLYYRLAQLGIKMTSGLCQLGPDGIAQKMYAKAIADGVATLEQMEVYIGDESDREKSTLPLKEYAIIRNLELIQKTEELASTVHPNWKACNAYARRMHSRNCHQILGYHLNDPVDAVITWTPNGNIQGGTATSLKLALINGIPVFNLGNPNKQDIINEIRQFLIDNDIAGVKYENSDNPSETE